MLRHLGHHFARVFRHFCPDPFVLAVLLTVVVFALAYLVTGVAPLEILAAWQGDTGFWNLLAFTMQMMLILVSGHALASSPWVRKRIRRLADLPRNGPQAAAIVSFVAIAAALLNWGLGLIVGALLARDVGRSCERRGIPVHYPLLVAAGYSGLLCWHGGLSGSAPLKVTSESDLARFVGTGLASDIGAISFTQTVLSIDNLCISGGLLLFVPLLCARLMPTDDVQGIRAYLGSESLQDQEATPEAPAESWAERLEESPFMAWVIGIPLAVACILQLRAAGLQTINPNLINLVFLTLGILLHGSLRAYASAVQDAIAGTAGMVLQFPFYAGIMGVVRTTGLAAAMSTWLAEIAPRTLYTTVTFLSAGLVNLFVPSGGGQWAVQGPIALEAAQRLEIPASAVVMAVAYGDQWTNMLQPFWALPLLAIAGIKAREIIGYTAVLMLGSGCWFIGCLIVQSYLF